MEGIAVGVAKGVATDNLALWLAIGAGLESVSPKEKEEEQDHENQK